MKLLVLAGAEAGKGMSGAPAVDAVTGSVVGVLRFSETGNARVLAIRAADILRRWPNLNCESAAEVPSYDTLVSTIAPSFAATAWRTFTPEKMHCVVVGSEASMDAPTDERLDALFQDVMADARASEVWKAFRVASDGRRVLQTGAHREFPDVYLRERVQIASFNIVDALSN